MKPLVIFSSVALLTAGCASPASTTKPTLPHPVAANAKRLNVPAKLLVIAVEVDGHRIGHFEAEVVSQGYNSSTGWYPSDSNNEVVINYGQSDDPAPVKISVRSVAPNPTFVAATKTVAPNSLPSSPFIFSLGTMKR